MSIPNAAAKSSQGKLNGKFGSLVLYIQDRVDFHHIHADQFFDRALYYAAVGYERERDRIGGRQRRRKGDK